jgi:hypothetical protein
VLWGKIKCLDLQPLRHRDMFFIKPSETNKKFNWVVQIIELDLQPL